MSDTGAYLNIHTYQKVLTKNAFLSCKRKDKLSIIHFLIRKIQILAQTYVLAGSKSSLVT